jgi:hypothetical protein
MIVAARRQTAAFHRVMFRLSAESRYAIAHCTFAAAN